MDEFVESYFQEYSKKAINGNFHKVIILHESSDLDWGGISQTNSNLPRGWYELTRLPREDRIEFTRDFWFSKLPYHPRIEEFLHSFFGSLNDIGVYLSQKTSDEAFQAQMVYCLEDGKGFFRGFAPAKEDHLLDLENQFPDVVFPQDYLAFMQIHNGFCKSTDTTGIIPTGTIAEYYQSFILMAEQGEVIADADGNPVNPRTLIPFYESFGMPFFQCFWSEWYPDQEMGNVYYSGEANTISDTRTRISSPENQSFPSFLDWLMFYLESIQ